MLPSDRPLPLDLCPACGVRPRPEPGGFCACGDYAAPYDPMVLDDTSRRLGLEQVARCRETLRLARRGRVLRERYARTLEGAA